MIGAGFVLSNLSEVPPVHYTLGLASLGAGGSGWTEDGNKALRFARREDAESFVNMFLPHQKSFITITRHEGNP